MRKLTTCLIIAVLLVGSTGSAFALPPCPSDRHPTTSPWFNCFGTFTFRDGTKYVGEFRNDKRNGQGTATFASGNKYVGEWKDGKEHGQGTFTWANGDKYVGEYRDDKHHGQGTYTWANGSKYVGEFRNDKANGQGTYTYASGSKYVGEFRNDKFNGQGIRYNADGTVNKEGIWKDDKFQYAQKVTTPVIARKSAPSKTGDYEKGLTAYNKKDYATALREFRPLAEQGDAEAQVKLGNLYYSGLSVSKDYKTALKWYRLAADQGHALAQSEVGVMYQKGEGVTQDIKIALKWYRLAAEQGDSYAQNNLGQMYEDGQGVPKDYKTALKWYKLAAEQGDSYAQSEVDRLQKKIAKSETAPPSKTGDYQKGYAAYVKGDYATALREWKPLAEQGNATVQYRLGVMYATGQGVPKNNKTALKWYRLAAKQGYAFAKSASEYLQKIIAKSETAQPSKSAADKENERLRKRIAELEKQKKSKPQIDPQKRLELARRTQEALQVMGLYSGNLDGIIGVRTRAAIRGWQRRTGYSETGEITEIQIVRLEQDATQNLANIAAHKKAEEDKQKQQELARQKARNALEDFRQTLRKYKTPPVETGTEEKKRKLAEARRNKVTNPDGVAVIIGNQNYTHGRVSKVAYAKRDAAAFRRYVTDVLGFRKGNIIDLRDATQAQMLAAFGNHNDHKGKLWRYLNPKRGSDVVVFYSGHGVPGQRSQRGYLLPVNADPNGVEINGYPIDLLYTNLGKLKAAKSIRVFLDACFSGDSHSGMLIRSASPVYFTAVLPKAKKKLTVLTAASGSQLASWDEKARHGLFTHHLLDALYGKADANTDGRVTAAETKEYLDEHMTMAARRTYGREQTASLTGVAGSILAAREGKTFPRRPASLPR